MISLIKKSQFQKTNSVKETMHQNRRGYKWNGFGSTTFVSKSE